MTTVCPVVKLVSRANPFNRVGTRPYWTCPKPVQLDAHVMVAPVTPGWAAGPWVIEQVVGVKVGVNVFVKVKVAVKVAVKVGVSVGVSVGVEVNVGVSVEVKVEVSVGVTVDVQVKVGVAVKVRVGVGVKGTVANVSIPLWAVTRPFRLRLDAT